MYLSNSITECQEWQIADVNHDNTVGTIDLFPKYLLDNYGVEFIGNGMFFGPSSGSYYLPEYNDSNYDLCKHLTAVYNGFSSDIRSSIVPISFTINGSKNGSYMKNTTLNATSYMKPPSITELGYTNTRFSGSYNEDSVYFDVSVDGYRYPLFNETPAKNGWGDSLNPSAARYQVNGTNRDYMTRTVTTGMQGTSYLAAKNANVMVVNNGKESWGYNGYVSFGTRMLTSNFNSDIVGTIAFIRFGKK